ncbi:MAG: TrgA family protein [Marinosulfonomonas sp.]|nr:TrgA family protein [Marinosulfonomonas sp.]
MPSAGRAVGAVLFAILVWFASELFKPLLPEGTAFGRFSEFNALFGVVLGWLMMGPRAHPNLSASITSGITATVAIVFWILLAHSIIEMLKLSLRKRYDGPVEAVVGVFQLMIKYGTIMATPEILGTLFISGMIIAVVSGRAERRFA